MLSNHIYLLSERTFFILSYYTASIFVCEYFFFHLCPSLENQTWRRQQNNDPIELSVATVDIAVIVVSSLSIVGSNKLDYSTSRML